MKFCYKSTAYTYFAKNLFRSDEILGKIYLRLYYSLYLILAIDEKRVEDAEG